MGAPNLAPKWTQRNLKQVHRACHSRGTFAISPGTLVIYTGRMSAPAGLLSKPTPSFKMIKARYNLFLDDAFCNVEENRE